MPFKKNACKARCLALIGRKSPPLAQAGRATHDGNQVPLLEHSRPAMTAVDRIRPHESLRTPARSRSSRRHLLAVAIACAAADAHAITITVNDASDSVAASGCTLRRAITAINAGAFAESDACATASSGSFHDSDAIAFGAALVGATITLQQGRLGIANPMTINGSQQTIDANAGSQAFYITASTTIANLTVTHGLDYAGSAFSFQAGTSTLRQVTVSGNANLGAGTGSINVVQDAALTLVDSTVSGNTSHGQTAGVYVSATFDAVDATISGNTTYCDTSFCSGAIYAAFGSVKIRGSTLSGNTVAAANTDYGRYVAGAVYAFDSNVSIVNSTMAGNHASGTDVVAGAIVESHGTGPEHAADGVTLTNTTVSGNDASVSADDAQHVSGGIMLGSTIATTGRLALGNSIVSGNSASGSAAPNPVLVVVNPENTPPLELRYSLLGSALDVAPYNDAENHNAFTNAPGLGPLQDNGGRANTMALLTGSAAIDKGSNALAIDANAQPLPLDQSGLLRIANGIVDIGAMEFASSIFRDGFE
jgi:hypothetical protein